jgi:hypothetical protein
MHVVRTDPGAIRREGDTCAATRAAAGLLHELLRELDPAWSAPSAEELFARHRGNLRPALLEACEGRSGDCPAHKSDPRRLNFARMISTAIRFGMWYGDSMKNRTLVFFLLVGTAAFSAEEDVQVWTTTEPAVFKAESLSWTLGDDARNPTNDTAGAINFLELHRGMEAKQVLWSAQFPGEARTTCYDAELEPGKTYSFTVGSSPSRLKLSEVPDYSRHELILIEAAGRVVYDRDFCAVHQRRMVRRELRILYGLVLPGSNWPSRVESEALFPNRETPPLGGCVSMPGISAETEWQSVCPDCTRAFEEWRAEKLGEGHVTDPRNRLFVIECVPRFEPKAIPGGGVAAGEKAELIISDATTTFRIPWRREDYPFEINVKEPYVFVVKGERDSHVEALGLLANGRETPEQGREHHFVSLIRVFQGSRMVFPAKAEDKRD